MRRLISAKPIRWETLAILWPIGLWAMLWLSVSPGNPAAILNPGSPAAFAQGLRAAFPLMAAGVASVIIGIKLLRIGPRTFPLFGPLALTAVYGLVGLTASVKSPDGSVALWWGALYLSAPIILWGAMWGSGSTDRIRRLVNATWLVLILTSAALFIVAALYLDLIEKILHPSVLLQCEEAKWFQLTGERLRSTGVGRYAAIAGLISISMLWQGRWRPIWLVVFPASLILLLYTGARGSFGSFAAGASLMLLIYLVIAGKRAMIAGLLAIAVLAPIIFGTGAHRSFLELCVFRTSPPPPVLAQAPSLTLQEVEPSPDSVNDWLQRAKAQNELGNVRQAIANYDQAINLEPQSASLYTSRGEAYSQLDQHDLAIQDYDQAIDLDPENSRVHSLRGQSHASLGRQTRAFQDLDKAIKLDPLNTSAYNIRGIAFFDRGESQRAIEDFDQAVRLKPQYADAFKNRGNAHKALSHLPQAVEDYTEAISLNSDLVSAYRNRAATYSLLGQEALAIQDYSTAELVGLQGEAARRVLLERSLLDYQEIVRLNPDDVRTWILRADTHKELGNELQAVNDYQRAIALEPGNARTHFNLAGAYIAFAQSEKAILELDQAIRYDAEYALAYAVRGGLFLDRNESQRAIQDLNASISLDHQYAPAYQDRALARILLGKFQQGIPDLDLAISLDPLNASAHGLRGDAYRKLGQPTQAIEDLAQAISIEPAGADFYNNRGLAYASLSQHERAIEDYDQAISIRRGYDYLNPKHAEPRFNKAVSLFELGRADEAIIQIDEALKNFPELAPNYEARLAEAFDISGAGLLNLRRPLQRAQDLEEPKEEARADEPSAPAIPVGGPTSESKGDGALNNQFPNANWGTGADEISAAVSDVRRPLGASQDLEVAVSSDSRQAATQITKTSLVTGDFFEFTGRTAVWLEGWRLIKSSPLIGYGFHADRLLLGAHMHNSVLHALFQAGFIGAILFVAAMIFAWALFFRIVRKLTHYSGAHKHLVIQCGGVLAFLTMRSFPESTGAFFGVDWLILAIVLAYLQVMNHGREQLELSSDRPAVERA